MKRTGKRMLSWLMALVMCMTMLPTSVFAAEGYDHHPDDDTKIATVASSTAEPTDKTIPEGTHWEGPVKGETICDKMEHTHTDDCYDADYGNCTHTCGLECLFGCRHKHTDACAGSNLGEGCPTRSYQVTSSYPYYEYTYYEHSHSEPGC